MIALIETADLEYHL